MHSGLINSGVTNEVSGPIPAVTPDSSPSQDPSPKTTPDPLELIAEGRQAIDAICRVSKMSILELAAHVCTAQNLEALARVAQLHAIEREVLLGRLKRDALVRLTELTDEVPGGSADEIRAFEVMRKACVDLLRYAGGTTGNTSPRQTHSLSPNPLTPASEAEVLEALERLGEERYEDEPRARASGSVELVPWSKSKTQATREGLAEVEATDEVQVGMAFGKTSDHGTGKISDPGTASKHTDSASRGCHGQVPPARACESPADSRAKSPRRPCPWPPPPPSESHLSMATISRNGPGAGASGSYSPPLPITDDRILPDDAHPP